LAIEEQYYIFWPLLFLLLRTFRRRLVLAFSLLLIAPFWRWLVASLSGGMQHVNWFRTDLRYTPLMIGCCLALLRYEGKLERFPLLKSPITALLACLAVVAGLNHLPHPAVSMITSLIGVAVLLNYAADHDAGMVGGFLNCSTVVWIGRLSYSSLCLK
jgi:peptidoglycan/LPS O-acetylase OafA/YrhL